MKQDIGVYRGGEHQGPEPHPLSHPLLRGNPNTSERDYCDPTTIYVLVSAGLLTINKQDDDDKYHCTQHIRGVWLE